jgi:hypothetical protein
MSMKHGILVFIPATVLAFQMSGVFAAEASQSALMSEAKVTEAQAKATALAKVPNGVVKSSGLEREHGLLVWSFDISRPSKRGVTEVQVDAKTGKVASMKNETPAQEAREVKLEEKAPK